MTVLVADGAAIVRDALHDVLEAEPGLCVVAVASTAGDAIALAQRHLPAAVVLDVQLPGGGLYAAQQIRLAVPNAKLIAFSALEETPERPGFARLGIHEYLLKGVPNQEIVAAIRGSADAGSNPDVD